jgi:hypothetical protein
MKGILNMNIQNFKDIHKQLNTKFPISDCTIKNPKEKGVYDSNKQYLCMIIDKRFKYEITFKIMKPYLWVGNETGIEEFKNATGYAWIDKDGNYVDNFENPVHSYLYYLIVIGFIEYKDDNDEELWELIKDE